MSATNVEKLESAKLKEKSAPFGGLICYFFATPTRLAAGLGTKELSPHLPMIRPVGEIRQIGSPAPFPKGNDLGDQLFNNEIIAVKLLYFKGSDALGSQKVGFSAKNFYKRAG